MLLPLSLLKYLLLHKVLTGDLGFSSSAVPILHHHRQDNSSSKNNTTDNLDPNEDGQQANSTTATSTSASQIQSQLKLNESKNSSSSLLLSPIKISSKALRIFPFLTLKPRSQLQPRQNFWAIPYGALVALNAIAAVITFFLIGLDIAAMISVSIAVPVGIGYLILIIIRIIKRILAIVFRFLFTGGTVVTYGGLHSLLNGRIRDQLLYWASYLQHRLREKGLKKERLLIYQLLSQRGELWEDFLALSFEDVQFSMADKKLAQMQKEADRLERYLALVRSRLNSEKWQRTKCRLENNCDD